MSRLRATRRLRKLKYWIESNSIKNREEMRHKVLDDFKKSQLQNQGTDETETDTVYQVKFEFKFKPD